MDYYSHIAASYNELYGAEQKRKLDFISQHFIPDPQWRLLDVGCGTGIALDYFGLKDAIGIDPSPGLLEQYNGPHPVFEGPAEEMPFEDEYFDVVISLTAIQNFSNIRRGLEEIYRVGKGGVGKGIYILTWLKASASSSDIKALVNEIFHDHKKQWLEEEKDIICIIGT